MTERDQAVVDALCSRMGQPSDRQWVEALKAGPGGGCHRPGTAEVYWVLAHPAFSKGGCYRAGMPEDFEDFVDEVRLHTWSVMCGGDDEERGVEVDPGRYEDHVVWCFVIDVEAWVISVAGPAEYQLRQQRESGWERMFAGLASREPSPALLEALTRRLCESNGWPYPGSLRLR